MSELSVYAKIKQALELAKAAGVGCTFSQFEAVELLGYIKAMEEYTADLRSELAAPKEAQRWIPVNERMPDKSGWYLVHEDMWAFCEFDGDGWLSNPDEHIITHWMPLPEPPEVE